MLNNFEAFAVHFKPTADSDQKAFTAMYNDANEGMITRRDERKQTDTSFTRIVLSYAFRHNVALQRQSQLQQQ
eukprot:COSAG02_NODE_530_length_20697_cov_20.103457_2_plen_73_part_00